MNNFQILGINVSICDNQFIILKTNDILTKEKIVGIINYMIAEGIIVQGDYSVINRVGAH